MANEMGRARILEDNVEYHLPEACPFPQFLNIFSRPSELKFLLLDIRSILCVAEAEISWRWHFWGRLPGSSTFILYLRQVKARASHQPWAEAAWEYYMAIWQVLPGDTCAHCPPGSDKDWGEREGCGEGQYWGQPLALLPNSASYRLCALGQSP